METLFILLFIAYLLTKTLKWDLTSSFAVFCIMMMFLCDETRLLFFIFIIIVQVQVKYLKRNRILS